MPIWLTDKLSVRLARDREVMIDALKGGGKSL